MLTQAPNVVLRRSFPQRTASVRLEGLAPSGLGRSRGASERTMGWGERAVLFARSVAGGPHGLL